MGWPLSRVEFGAALELTTDLEVDRRDARISLGETLPGGPRILQEVTFRVTDVVLDDPSVQPEFDRIFDIIAGRVAEVVGRPADFSWTDPRGLRWGLPNVVITLNRNANSVSVELLSPQRQLWYDEIDRSLEND